MTCVFELLIFVVPLVRKGDGPRFGVGLGIVNGKFVVQCVFVGESEAFNHPPAFVLGCPRAWCPHVAHRFKIGRLDDKRVALPPTTWVAFPLGNVRVHVRVGVDRDNASIVDHLAVDNDVVLGLHEQFAVVVGGWHHHPEDTPRQAAVARLHVGSHIVQVGAIVMSALLSSWRHLWHLAIRWVNDQRGRFSGYWLSPEPVEPIVCIGTDASTGLVALPLDRLGSVGSRCEQFKALLFG